MSTKPLILLLLLPLAGCSTTQMKSFGGHVVDNVVGLAFDVLRDDEETATAWVPAYERCDTACQAQRQRASARIAEEARRREARERREDTVDAFESFMEERDAAAYVPASETPLVFTQSARLPE